ncbi:YbfB/YjiJ family MFS transporter [Nocardia otitidiscaviarum]|uniref:YbfB/YjiJ family MFS transporter n=1 Tax=Nocardia otitidiscaviarum TaxID=1823 RepID=UPI00163DB7E7|nr:YbfB/YjiJ family MFS transporter [Nocardia otitidiscaviarum]MCP9624642.1 YbfB/YjiJ family MFS transporter [Nocardia otitidiscaviarum]
MTIVATRRLGLGTAVAAAAGLAAAVGVGRFVYTPLLPTMVDAGRLDAHSGALVAAANYAGYLLGAVALARRPEWNGRSTFRLAAMALIVSDLLMAIPAAPAVAAVLRFVAGIASAALFIGCAAVAARHENRRRAAGIVFSGVGAGIAAAGLLVLLTQHVLSWQALWLVSAAVTAALLAPTRRLDIRPGTRRGTGARAGASAAPPDGNPADTADTAGHRVVSRTKAARIRPRVATEEAAYRVVGQGEITASRVGHGKLRASRAGHSEFTASRTEQSEFTASRTEHSEFTAPRTEHGEFTASRTEHGEFTASRTGHSELGPPRPGRVWLALRVSYLLEGLGYIVIGTFLVAAVAGPGRQAEGTLMWILVGSAAAPSTVLWGAGARRWSASRMLVLALILQAISAAMPAVSSGTAAALVSAVLFGATFMGIVMLAMEIGDDLVDGPAAATLTAGYGFGQMLGPLVVAPVLGSGYTAAFGIATAVLLAAAAAALVVHRSYASIET